MKRGLASPPVTSALPTTRRLQLQLSSVDQVKSLKRRADLPVRKLSNFASISSVLIACSSRSLRARPNRKLTRFAAQQNTCLRPAATDLRDNACHLLDRTGGAVDVRPPQPGRQQMTTTEDVERQITVTIIIAVEEPALLVAV